MRWAIVTGGAGGIGRAACHALSADGHGIIVLDVDEDGASEVAQELADAGSTAVAYQCDLVAENEVTELSERLLYEHGAPAVLVNNAGVGLDAGLSGTSSKAWSKVLSVNVTAPFLLCRAFVPAMVAAGGGIIVNVASIAGLVGLERRVAYCASKASLIGLTRAIAADHAAEGIRINALCPGTVHTPWTDQLLAASADPEALFASMAERQLDGRLGTVEEVALGISFLASEAARFVNGSAFVMDGGWTAR